MELRREVLIDNHKEFRLKSAFHSSLKEIYSFWFNPSPLLPPFREFIDMNFVKGGYWRAIIDFPEKKGAALQGIFLDLEPEKEIVSSWRGITSSSFECQVSFEETSHKETEVSLSLKGERLYTDIFNKKAVHLYFLAVQAFFGKRKAKENP